MKDKLPIPSRHNALRWLDEMPRDYTEAFVALVDALRDYIRSNESVLHDIVIDETITRDEYERALKRLEPYRAMLEEMEMHGIDPTLNGLIKHDREGEAKA